MKTATLIIVLFSFSKAFCQNGKFGVNFNFNSSRVVNIYQGEKERSEPMPTLDLGLSYYSNLDNQIFYKTGINFSSKGGKDEAFGEYEKFRYDYIDIPLLFGYRYNLNQMNSSVALLGGPFIGYAISGKYKYKEDGAPEEVDDVFSGDVADQPRRFNYGLDLGASFEYNKQITFSIRKIYTLGNIVKDADDYRIRFNSTSFGVCYFF